MVTGPMPRKPKATRPKAKMAEDSSKMLSPLAETKKAATMRPTMTMPFQKALKLPATIPERMVREAPPSREAVTTSCTWRELELVNALVSSGIMAAAKVPKLMMEAKRHHKLGSGVIAPMSELSLTKSLLLSSK